MAKTAKVIKKASKPTKAKGKPAEKSVKAEKVAKTVKPAKGLKAKPVKATKALKTVKKSSVKVSAPKAKTAGSKRMINDAKLAKLQKMYASKKHSAQSLCDEFGISMATLFNYLKVKI